MSFSVFLGTSLRASKDEVSLGTFKNLQKTNLPKVV